MNVKELVEKLKKFDQNLNVEIEIAIYDYNYEEEVFNIKDIDHVQSCEILEYSKIRKIIILS